jgi:hypothetical protein
MHRLRMNGAIPLLHLLPSWWQQRQVYLFYIYPVIDYIISDLKFCDGDCEKCCLLAYDAV